MQQGEKDKWKLKRKKGEIKKGNGKRREDIRGVKEIMNKCEEMKRSHKRRDMKRCAA